MQVITATSLYLFLAAASCERFVLRAVRTCAKVISNRKILRNILIVKGFMQHWFVDKLLMTRDKVALKFRGCVG